MLSGTSCWVLTDGKAGDLVQCVGVAEALGLSIEERVVRPRPPWSWFAPYGPPDPRDAPGQHGGALAGRFPALAIASGRRAVPPLRALKRASGGRTFTIFLKQPGNGARAADVIWVPEHDTLRGPNVIVTLTSPTRFSRARLDEARAAPDPRVAALPAPRVAMILGGPSRHYRYDAAFATHVAEVAETVLASGRSLMVTPSRRTPAALIEVLSALARASPDRVFVWQGAGANPYASMLALAAAVVVTADSVNMLGEAAITGAPLHVIEPAGGHRKMTRFIAGLIAHGAARRWAGAIEGFDYPPLDPTPLIAAEIEARFRASHSAHL